MGVNLTKEQNDVITVKDRNLLVSASAGSGKTFVVVERIVNRILKDNIDIDKILVVTFTNAAAAELKERIVKRFYELIKKDDLEEEKKLHIRRQLSLINRSQISTIHSFCLSIIKNNFYVLNIDPSIRTLEENKAKLMILESIDEIIEEEYEKKTDTFQEILELFKSDENIIEYIEKIYNFSKSMINPKEWLENSLNKYRLDNTISDLSEIDFGNQIIISIKERFELLRNELENICNKIRGDKDFDSRLKVLEDMLEKISNVENLLLYDDIYSYIKNNLEFPRLPSSKCINETLKKEVTDIKKKVTTEINNISKMVYKDTAGIIYELSTMYNIIGWFVTAVMKLDEIYSIKKRKTGYIDFNDYEHLALKVLQNEAVKKQYINKFEEIYVDEYQDTSYIQEVILKSISKNNRIMVGDVKQSIYSFRNAEPRLFNEKYREYRVYNNGKNSDNDSVKILLSKNFRSRESVLNSINDIFNKTMSDKIGECNYNEQEYLLYGDGYDKSTEQDCKTEINILEIENEEIESIAEEEILEINNTEKEAYMIADKIKELISSDRKLYDTKSKTYRKITYKDIVILLRSANKKADIYEEILRKNNIPAFSDASDSFYSGQEVSIILSFLKIIDNIYDDVSLVSSMYSIIGNFTVDDLVYIRKYNKQGYFYDSILEAYNDENNKDKEIYLKIDKFLNTINTISKYLNTYTIAETFLKIYEDTGIYYSFYLEEKGKQKCANLDRLVEIARSFEKEERSSIYEFINYIESIKNKKTKGADTPKLLGENEDVVRILTIHKSKGLEYPIVFIADAAKKYNNLDIASEILLDKSFGIGIDIYDLKLGISYASIVKQAIKEKIKNKILSEEERLLYVAMTRAKEKLYIYGTVKNYDNFINKLLVIDSNKISPVVVKECNNYLKLIMLVLNSFTSNYFNLNVISTKEINMRVSLLGNKNNIDRKISLKDKFLGKCKDNDIKEKNIDTSFSKEYKYLDRTDIKKKYTVTELKNIGKEDEKVYNLVDKEKIESLENIKPKCIEKNISNMNYGNIIHKILENINYFNITENNIKNIIQDVCEGIANINQDIIHNIIKKYLNSQIINYIKEAVVIHKEQPFVIYDDLNDLEGLRLKEKSYIQGVIDLYIETKKGQNIIVDFKTDKIDFDNELIEKYKYQLAIYKKGIELSLNKKIDEVYIYSFHMQKLIKVNT